MPIAAKAGVKPGVKPTAKPVAGSTGAVATLVAKEAHTTVTQTLLENGTIKGEPVTASEVEIKTFVGPTANVGVGVQYTRNLGNFESVKVNVMINAPCYPEETDNMFAQVLDKAKAKLEEAIEALQIAPSEATGDDPALGEDGAAEETGDEAETGEGDEIGIDYLKEADAATLAELATSNPDLEVNPDDYAEEEDLRQVLIQAILGEEVLQEYLGAQEGAGEDGDGEQSEGYTEEELGKATADELKEIFTSWELGDYPKGPAPIAKKAAIKKILAAQNGG